MLNSKKRQQLTPILGNEDDVVSLPKAEEQAPKITRRAACKMMNMYAMFDGDVTGAVQTATKQGRMYRSHVSCSSNNNPTTRMKVLFI
jgi:hypothetical protein